MKFPDTVLLKQVEYLLLLASYMTRRSLAVQDLTIYTREHHSKSISLVPFFCFSLEDRDLSINPLFMDYTGFPRGH